MPSILNEARELRRLWAGFQTSRVILTANNLRVFDYLKKPVGAQELAHTLGTDKRATEILLNALTGLGLLRKNKAKYKNTKISNKFLTKESPYYQGDSLRHADTLWRKWSGLDEVLRTGRPSRVAHEHETFINAMHNIAFLRVRYVLKEMNLKGVKTALDLGGGPGTYAMEMAKRGVSVTIFDVPETIRIAKTLLSKEQVKGVRFIEGDFLKDNIGKVYDLIFISQVLHAYGETENISLLKKCKSALNERGRVVIHEFYISDDKIKPLQGALFSVNMLINTERGRCYSPSEIKNWLLKADFKKVSERPVSDTILIEGQL